nr:CapA family protein [Bacteroidaceae bacterium]
ESTYKSLKSAGIEPMGCGRNVKERLTPVLIKKGNLCVAVFSDVLFPIESWFPNPENRYSPCQADVSNLCRAIREYKEENPEHKVLAYLHWGVEYQDIPTQPQRMQASRLVFAGADAIVGHHPHVVQTFGRIDGRPVFYSLGHLVFDSLRPKGNKGLIVRLVVTADTIIANTVDVKIRKCKPVL